MWGVWRMTRVRATPMSAADDAKLHAASRRGPGRRRCVAFIASGVVAAVAAAGACAGTNDPRATDRLRVVNSTSESLTTSPSLDSATATSAATSTSIVLGTAAGSVPMDGTAAPTVIRTEATNPAQPASFSALPHTDLPDEAFVQVAGSGLPAGENFLWIVECPVAAVGVRACDFMFHASSEAVYWFADDSGNLNTNQPAPVRRVLGDGTDCSIAAGSCELRLYLSGVVLARVPLSFTGPPGPRVPGSLRFEPATNLVDGQQVHVDGDHLMAGDVFSIQQCVGDVCEYPGHRERTSHE